MIEIMFFVVVTFGFASLVYLVSIEHKLRKILEETKVTNFILQSLHAHVRSQNVPPKK